MVKFYGRIVQVFGFFDVFYYTLEEWMEIEELQMSEDWREESLRSWTTFAWNNI